jgi:hypothetical protein
MIGNGQGETEIPVDPANRRLKFHQGSFNGRGYDTNPPFREIKGTGVSWTELVLSPGFGTNLLVKFTCQTGLAL